MKLPDFCWCVRGEDSNGNFWMTRYIPGFDCKNIQEAQKIVTAKASRMNSLGANVAAFKQKNCGDTWQDCD